MNDSDLKVELEWIMNDLGKVDGVEGSLIVDRVGNILSQRILPDIDVDLFGPMAHVITSSSKRLLNSSNQGEIQRVLVESENGKALFLHLGNVQFIVLMENHANVGLILVSSKRAAEKIISLTKDLEMIHIEEDLKSKPLLKLDEEEIVEVSSPNLSDNTETEVEEVLESDEEIISITAKQDDNADELVLSEISEPETKKMDLDEISEEKLDAEEKEKLFDKSDRLIPIIKPPISFPDIKKVVEVPDNAEERANLILDIYEAIFRAMSIGASKIMGVAPARGLTQKFLPLEHCKKLLDGVNVRSNSTIDFEKIRENANKIPVKDRDTQFIEDFTKIIEVVTDNYGKVMGYGAFRGMVRPEFKIITNSYGPVMKKLGITDKMHSEMAELFL
jgi:predicted regulator of Ras-like GTPase activity (Roadblock/LC7/MglB family)